MTIARKVNYLDKGVIKNAEKARQKIVPSKTAATKKWGKGYISTEEKKLVHNSVDEALFELKKYINFYKARKDTISSKGIKVKKGRGAYIFNNAKEMLQKLTLIIAEIEAGNTSIKMRNMGQSILDALLRSKHMNKHQYQQLVKKYFTMYYKMEREITLSSFSVKNERGNRPGDFTTRFKPTIVLDNNTNYYIGFNRTISMFFTWTTINAGYNNQKIAFSKDNGNSFTDIDFAQGVWTYTDLDNCIKEKTKTINGDGNEDYSIKLTFDEPTFLVIITLAANYQLDLTKSDFNGLIGYN